jgi:hypothetical protein
MGDKISFLDASTNGKATLATSRHSFIAVRNLCAGVAFGLCLGATDLTALIMLRGHSFRDPLSPIEGLQRQGCSAAAVGLHSKRPAHAQAKGSTSEKPRGEVFAVAGIKPHALGTAPRQDAEAVMLDLVQPVGTAWRGLGR